MECPHCDAELVHEDTYGYLCAHQSGEVLGQIYRCPNHEGFETEDEALRYRELADIQMDSDETWVDVRCVSCTSHVSGAFYTDKQDNLHEGYPC